MMLKQKSKLSLVYFLLAALTGCASLLPTSIHGKKIQMPVAAWPGYEYMALAKQLKLDEKHGYNLEIKDYQDPQLIVRDLAWGNLPIAQMTTVEVVDLCSRLPKRCPIIILILDESRGGDQLVARQSISSVKDLKGKSVAINPTTLGPYILIRALQKNNLQINDVKLITMGMEAMPVALKEGKVDVIATYPPFSERAKQDGQSRKIFDSSLIPGEIFDVLVVDPTFLERNQSLIANVVTSWAAAHQLAIRNPTDSLRFMANREGITVEEFKEVNQGLIYFDLASQEKMLESSNILEKNIKAIHQGQISMGLISKDGVIPKVTNEIVKMALTQR